MKKLTTYIVRALLCLFNTKTKGLRLKIIKPIISLSKLSELKLATISLIAMFLLSPNFSLNGYGKNNQQQTRLDSTSFAISGLKGTTVKIECWRHYLNKPTYFIDTIIVLTEKINHFKIILPERLAYLQIKKIVSHKSDEIVLPAFLMAPTDDLKFEIKDTKLTCTGVGSERFELMTAVKKELAKVKIDTLAYQTRSKLERQLILLKPKLDVMLKVLATYKPLYNHLIYSTSQIDIIGLDGYKRYYMINETIGSKEFKTDIVFANKVRQLIAKEFVADEQFKLDTTLLAYSRIYREMLLLKIEAINRLNSQGDIKQQTKLALNYIDHTYKGTLKEFLFAHLLAKRINVFDPQSFQPLLDRLVTLAKHPIVKAMVQKLQRANAQNEPSYAIELPDSTGKIVKLADFKGKVVLIDFWFTGCVNCIHHNEDTLTPAYQSLKQDTNLVFMSICVDKDIDKWRESLRAGEYTVPNAINLYTNGEGGTHPLIKHYSITAYPHTFLIDKLGRTYSSSYTTNNAAELTVQLKKLLAAK